MKDFLRGKIIKHRNNMDVCYKVLAIYEGSKKYKIKARIINMAFVESFAILDMKIGIDKDQIDNWFVCQEPFKKCLRDSGWSPIGRQ